MTNTRHDVLADLTRLILESGAVTFRDAATRQRVEEDLRRAAAMARFPEMNPGPVVRTDPDGLVLLANQAARGVFGLDFVGRNWRQICTPIDDRFWQRMLSSPGVISLEARFGEREFVFAHRFDPAAQLVFAFGSDITSQKRAERALAQSEKMATLGTLAAGVAHELNNPAAATRRAAEQLRDGFSRLEQAHIILARFELTDPARDALLDLDRQARDQASQQRSLSALERSDRETAIEDWLDDRGIGDAPVLAPALVGLNLDPPALDRIAALFDDTALEAVLVWASRVFPVHMLLYEIGQGSSRISEIVRALKSYSFLGQAPVQWVNLHEGLDNTLVILRNKLKAGIDVVRDYDTTLPNIPAFGAELNQVWTNLLDNAADAIGGKGRIIIRTHGDDGWAVVEIEDDGPGIPAAIQSRIFDPFFTTKAPGKGTGMGLSTTYSIVTEKHHGRIAVDSRPGSTRFTVSLPLQEPAAAPAAATST